MGKTYRPLPEGPVICEACARSGRHVEMHRDKLEDSYLETPLLLEGSELQSYRCPDCENVTVFRVT